MKLELLGEIINAYEGVTVESREEILKWILISFLESENCPVGGCTLRETHISSTTFYMSVCICLGTDRKYVTYSS